MHLLDERPVFGDGGTFESVSLSDDRETRNGEKLARRGETGLNDPLGDPGAPLLVRLTF